MKKRVNLDIENWVESYEAWSGKEAMECDSTYNHDDWDVPVKEICRIKAFDYQLFLGRAYNFIMEFQFDTDNKGYGYLYAVEFER